MKAMCPFRTSVKLAIFYFLSISCYDHLMAIIRFITHIAGALVVDRKIIKALCKGHRKATLFAKENTTLSQDIGSASI